MTQVVPHARSYPNNSETLAKLLESVEDRNSSDFSGGGAFREKEISGAMAVPFTPGPGNFLLSMGENPPPSDSFHDAGERGEPRGPPRGDSRGAPGPPSVNPKAPPPEKSRSASRRTQPNPERRLGIPRRQEAFPLRLSKKRGLGVLWICSPSCARVFTGMAGRLDARPPGGAVWPAFLPGGRQAAGLSGSSGNFRRIFRFAKFPSKIRPRLMERLTCYWLFPSQPLSFQVFILLLANIFACREDICEIGENS